MSFVRRVKVFKKWPRRALTTHHHPYIISPLATFSAPHLSTGSCTNIDNVVVLPSANIVDFRQYWADLHSSSDFDHVEFSACLTLARLLSAVLYLNENSSDTPRLLLRRVLMAVQDTGESVPLLLRSTQFSTPVGTLASDIVELIVVMLQLESSAELVSRDAQRRKSEPSTRRESAASVDAISSRTAYSRCLQRVVRSLCQKNGSSRWNEGLKESLQLLEFTLWGPSEDEARMIAVSDSRDTALRVWLSVARCHLLAELSVVEGRAKNGLEVVEKAMFLSTSTEESLLEVTKLLFA